RCKRKCQKYRQRIALPMKNEVYYLLLLSQRLSPVRSSRQTASCLAIVRLRKRKVFVGFAHTHNL
ncbi:hypothetical protein, partial [uncultured Ruminococcus sp.]|uniref:hypothetical protein n=1 Tax=uncultured Ruminococcus sp. TaxID=165186 RepID=UPI002665D201